MDRRRKLLLMQDILEHLGSCFSEWQHVEGGQQPYLAEAIERDLNEFRRLCDSLRSSCGLSAIA